MNTISEGDFKSLPISNWDREMLEDAYQAVTKAKRWDFLRREDVPGPNGFMFSDWPQVKDIDTFMEYGGHSGASYGYTMRVMEFIAKRGWAAYVLKVQQEQKKKEEEEAAQKAMNSIYQVFQGTDAVPRAIWGMSDATRADPGAFAEALQANPAVREVIPDIDEQTEAMKKYAKGEMSYAEMRGICG